MTEEFDGIFLDIDGVLNSSSSFMARCGPQNTQLSLSGYRNLVEEYGNEIGLLPYIIQSSINTVDPVAVGLLNRLVKLSGAKIVLCSSHRVEFKNTGRQLEALRFYLQALGVTGELIGITPSLHKARGLEVDKYMSTNPFRRYVILDDGKDFLDHQNHVLVKDGFKSTDYFAATKHLGVTETLLIT